MVRTGWFPYELTNNYHDVVNNNYQRFIEVAYNFQKQFQTHFLKSCHCELDIKLMMPDGNTRPKRWMQT